MNDPRWPENALELSAEARADIPLARLCLELPRASATVAVARRVLRHVLSRLGASDRDAADVELAVSELATNAVVHAGAGELYELEVALGPDTCEIAVFDHGLGFDPRTVTPPTLKLVGGRGLAIVRGVMDDVEVDAAPGMATMVRARKRLAALAGGSLSAGAGDAMASVVVDAVRRFGGEVARLGGTIR